MKLEHVAMYVNDLEHAKQFFVTYFDAKPNKLYYNILTGFRSYFLTLDDGAKIEIMNKPNMNDADKSPQRTGFIHIALSVGSKEKVDSLTEQLQNDGYEVLTGPRTTGDGHYESTITAIEGNQIEITI